MEEFGGINIYAFVNNNPLYWVDSDGRQLFPAILQAPPVEVPIDTVIKIGIETGTRTTSSGGPGKTIFVPGDQPGTTMPRLGPPIPITQPDPSPSLLNKPSPNPNPRQDSAACHRGRIQAQGAGLEAFVSWAQSYPPSVEEGLGMVAQLEAKLSRGQLKVRADALYPYWQPRIGGRRAGG
jgi:hypothetical protein